MKAPIFYPTDTAAEAEAEIGMAQSVFAAGGPDPVNDLMRALNPVLQGQPNCRVAIALACKLGWVLAQAVGDRNEAAFGVIALAIQRNWDGAVEAAAVPPGTTTH